MTGIELSGVGNTLDALGSTADDWGQPVDDQTVSNPVDHARPVEFGAVITPTDAEYLHFSIGGEEIFTKGPIVQEPQPYFRPAAEATRSEMAQIATQADSLRDYVERVQLYFHSEAVRRTPRDTGELQAGWQRS